MNIYNSNILFLCEQRKLSITEFENVIYIPKIRINDPYPEELLRIANYFGLSTDILLKKDLKLAASAAKKEIKLVVLDVDGTLTDGGMYYSESGDQFKKYNTKDGMAIKTMISKGVAFGIISHSSVSRMVEDRAKTLGIQHVYVGNEDKISVLKQFCAQLGITSENVAYVGDDINDIAVMEACGLSACPADALKSVKAVADIILVKDGGKGCVREFLDEWVNH